MQLKHNLLVKEVKKRRRHLVLRAYAFAEDEGWIDIASELTFNRSSLAEYGLQEKYLKNRPLVVKLRSRKLEETHIDRLIDSDLILDSLKKEEEFNHGAYYDLCRIKYRPSSRKICLAHFLSANLVPDYFSGIKPKIPELSSCFYDLTLKISDEEYRQLQEQSKNPKEHHVFDFSFKLR